MGLVLNGDAGGVNPSCMRFNGGVNLKMDVIRYCTCQDARTYRFVR